MVQSRRTQARVLQSRTQNSMSSSSLQNMDKNLISKFFWRTQLISSPQFGLNLCVHLSLGFGGHRLRLHFGEDTQPYSTKIFTDKYYCSLSKQLGFIQSLCSETTLWGTSGALFVCFLQKDENAFHALNYAERSIRKVVRHSGAVFSVERKAWHVTAGCTIFRIFFAVGYFPDVLCAAV